MIKNKIIWGATALLILLLFANIKIWHLLLKKEEVTRFVLSSFSESYLKYNLTLPEKGEAFVVKIESSAPQLYFRRAMDKAFPEYKVIYTTTNSPSPHLIYRGIIPSDSWIDEFKNLVPYFVGNHEPNYFTPSEYRVTGKPFMVANDHIQFPYEANHEFIPLVALSYQGIKTQLYNNQTNFGKYKKQRNKGIVYVNYQYHPHRDKLFYMLKEKLPDKVHALGRCPIGYNEKENSNIPSRQEGWDKLGSIYQEYNFVFAMENAKMRGYISEKILNAYNGRSIPIYWGDSQMARRFFNSNSYIDVDSFNSFEEATDYIVNIVNSKELTEKYLNTPMFTDKNNIDPLLLIEQSGLSLESEKIIDDFAKKLRSLYFKNIKKREKNRLF
jgi:hypothetical protein